MAHVTGDRVKDTTTTTGTGNITLANSAPTGFRTLDAVAATSDTFFYALELSSEWEVGLGTYSGSHVFVRTTVLASSNSNAAVNFSAGTKNFFITLPASKIADNTAYASSWDGETAVAPSKNAVYDKLVQIDAGIHPGYIVGNWYFPDYGPGAVGGSSTFAANTIYYVPFTIRRAITISDLGAFVSTSTAGNLKLAIYANNAATGRPTGTPLAETGNISTASVANVSADITGSNVTLQPGLYWAAFWADASGAGVQSFTAPTMTAAVRYIGAASQATMVPSSGLANFLITSAETFGTWPDAASETLSEVTNTTRNYILQMKAA